VRLTFASSKADALENADALVIVTIGRDLETFILKS
jgi:hypothetical protein